MPSPAPNRHAALALLLAAAGVMLDAVGLGATGAAHAEDGKAPAGAPLKVVVFDVEAVGLPGTQAMRDKLAAATGLLRKLVTERGYTVVDNAPQAKRIADNTPLSQCNGCDQRIAQALGADVEIATALQAVSAATYSLSGSVKDVKSDRVLRQGVVDVRGEDPGVWAHGVKFLLKERLFDPPLPADAAGLSAAEQGADR